MEERLSNGSKFLFACRGAKEPQHSNKSVLPHSHQATDENSLGNGVFCAHWVPSPSTYNPMVTEGSWMAHHAGQNRDVNDPILSDFCDLYLQGQDQNPNNADAHTASRDSAMSQVAPTGLEPVVGPNGVVEAASHILPPVQFRENSTLFPVPKVG